MISEHIDRLISPCRDGLARVLVRAGFRPNHITLLGMLCTWGAGVAVAAGRAHWRPWAVSLLVAAGACDLLDGAMATRANLRTRFGAILDSTCDRASDAALYFGAVFYFLVAWPREQAGAGGGEGAAPNLTLAVLAAAGLVWAYLISYIRARAANEQAEAGGGFWQRPERVVTLLLGLAFHHLPTAIWILGTLPLTTIAHRVWRAWRTSAAAAPAAAPAGEGKGAPAPDEPRGLAGLVLWRWRRGTLPFDLYAGAVIAALLFWDLPPIDPLRRLLAYLVGA